MAARGDPEQVLADRDHVTALADVYGSLLTSRQRELLGLYYEEDLSLAEVAMRAGVSRQAVHDLLRRTVAILQGYEARLGVLGQTVERRVVVAELVAALQAAASTTGTARTAPLQRALALARGLAEG